MHSIRPRVLYRGLQGLSKSTGLSHRITPTTTRLTHQPARGSASPERAFQERIQEISQVSADPYPRLVSDVRTVSCGEFRTRYAKLANNESVDEPVVVSGRIRTYRLAGSKLIFFDIVQDGHKIQVMCNKRQLEGVSPEQFKKLYRLLRRGDAFSVTGKPHRTGRGELTVEATELPTLLAPCLHDVPLRDSSHETSPYPRHVQFLADPTAAQIIRARSSLTQYLRQFFVDRSFMEVNTPILGGSAGGAIARPFLTSATEFPERELSLRIAPELWLKRLVVGGFDKVFEIGSSFRNEGIDKTHNPEFTTCEFYHAYANLEDLMRMTEDLLSGMASHIKTLNQDGTLNPTTANFATPFRRIDFIGGIEERIHRKLPDLTSPLPSMISELFSKTSACLYQKTLLFLAFSMNSIVAARGELFIEGKEVVNTYEEENSPFEQRRKFEDQLRFSKAAGEPGEVDENYLEALEWGLPSTGGWGCGIDRLVMLFTGAKRIGDVLPFGTLRAVTRRTE
ncbi:hypothetical protein N7450_008483 [Penicillium hetheringtonii]|uniref:Lysyl-tRNA synthetase n=1 Tax=Penicillium hetheringtonii TaxID=911720 RepID=A0AAD6DDU6_9EURO|nr:hypothetical protein N7450_008483 [Penicillium hetheringtonii]